MGKAAKEHRKRVQARNRRIEQERKLFRKSFQDELLRQIELQKSQQNAVEDEDVVEEVVTEIKRINPETEPDAE